MKTLFSIILIAGPMLAGNATAAENCKYPQSQSGMNTCAGKDYELDDARLNTAYKELVSKLEKDRREKVKEIQIAWIKYRDLQCDFDSSNYEGGTMYSLVRSSCLSQITKQRTKDLKAMLEDALR
jgi:uncharacterized protein YecT (DUF1311 family)